MKHQHILPRGVPPLDIELGSFAEAHHDPTKRPSLHRKLELRIIHKSERIVQMPEFAMVDSTRVEQRASASIAHQIVTVGKGPIWLAGFADEANHNDEHPWHHTELHLDQKVEGIARHVRTTEARRRTVNNLAALQEAQAPDTRDHTERPILDLLDDAGLLHAWQQLPHIQRLAYGITQHFPHFPPGTTLHQKYQVLESCTGVPAGTWRTLRHRAMQRMWHHYSRDTD